MDDLVGFARAVSGGAIAQSASTNIHWRLDVHAKHWSGAPQRHSP